MRPHGDPTGTAAEILVSERERRRMRVGFTSRAGLRSAREADATVERKIEQGAEARGPTRSLRRCRPIGVPSVLRVLLVPPVQTTPSTSIASTANWKWNLCGSADSKPISTGWWPRSKRCSRCFATLPAASTTCSTPDSTQQPWRKRGTRFKTSKRGSLPTRVSSLHSR